MSKNGDWFKVYRCIEDSEFYFAERFTRAQAWFDLLLLATYKPRTLFLHGVEVKLRPGQLCWSQLSLAKRWKWNRKTVSAFLSMLSRREMVDIRISKVTSIISIRNWEKYQGNGQQNGQQKDNRTGTNKKVNTVKKVKNTYRPSEGMSKIFSHWNSKGIRPHRQLTEDMERAFRRSALSEAEVIQAIDNYLAVLADPESFFSYRWRLEDFLGRKNGARKFVESEILNQFKKNNKAKVYGAEAI